VVSVSKLTVYGEDCFGFVLSVRENNRDFPWDFPLMLVLPFIN